MLQYLSIRVCIHSNLSGMQIRRLIIDFWAWSNVKPLLSTCHNHSRPARKQPQKEFQEWRMNPMRSYFLYRFNSINSSRNPGNQIHRQAKRDNPVVELGNSQFVQTLIFECWQIGTRLLLAHFNEIILRCQRWWSYHVSTLYLFFWAAQFFDSTLIYGCQINCSPFATGIQSCVLLQKTWKLKIKNQCIKKYL